MKLKLLFVFSLALELNVVNAQSQQYYSKDWLNSGVEENLKSVIKNETIADEKIQTVENVKSYFGKVEANVLYRYYSDFQLDKTYEGNKVEGRRKVYITFSDPKNATREGMKFEDLPKGYIKIKYETLDEIKGDIIYLNQNQSGNDIYAINNSSFDYDVLYIIKENHKIGNKNYSHIILVGKADLNNPGGLPQYFTAYHANAIKK